jgi:thiamine-phosphate pyrophosphorylase
MLIYVITDRRLRPDLDPLDLVEQAARSGADMIQVREKDLDAVSLAALVRRAVSVAAAPVYVNQRADVALAAGASGVHLPADGLPVQDLVSRWPELRRGQSTHGRPEAVAAEAAGAHFITCGPVFDTPSKRPFGPPLGLQGLREAAEAVRLPVIAIGGIHAGNVGRLAGIPIAGVAMISAVITASDMGSAVARLREAAA